ncbi:uncharacterized protein BP5553_08973 [Venustampulla echinocandica]|uniref:Uncharacterized protein n=1 Tax=Venustampulla echinocandica TaxID=2656787 RepID=A0A370TDI5_9HELO|nr:uncharacterized protein BP5553_08973 [Venustampulla echinocandica]RDL32517.1 hypothetical protein BP5553_08973 [Venustampulla echinocandica]
MSQSLAYRHWLRALSLWPKDKLRPNLQFQDVMRRRIDQRFDLIENPDAKNPLAKTVVDEKAELEQANAAYSLLGDRYAKKTDGLAAVSLKLLLHEADEQSGLL